jgi:hypothetical protein
MLLEYPLLFGSPLFQYQNGELEEVLPPLSTCAHVVEMLEHVVNTVENAVGV